MAAKPIPIPVVGAGMTRVAPPAPIVWNDDDIRRRSKMITKLFPTLKKQPKTLHILASQSVPDDHLTEQVLKTVGFEMIQRQARLLPKMDGGEQREAWEGMKRTQRQMLKQAGYQGPPEEEDGGILGGLVDAVTNAPGIRAVTDLTKGHYMDALGDVPIVGGIPAVVKGEGPIEAIGRSTGIAQAVEGADSFGELTDIGGKVTGEALRNTGLGEVADVFHTVSSGAEEYVAKPLLRGLNTLGGGVEQGYRLMRELGKNDVAYRSPNPFDTVTNEKSSGGAIVRAGIGAVTGDEKPVKHFLDAWESTAVGNRYFNDDAKFRAEEILDGDPYQVEAVTQLAGGSSIDDIAAKYGPPGTPAYQEEFLKLTALSSTENFTRAIKALNNGHVSPGNDIVRGLGIEPSSGGGQALSLATDAVIGWYADPLLVAGKMRAAWKAKEAITTAEGISTAFSKGTQAVEDALGHNWEERLRAGEITLNQVTGVDKRMGTAAEMAQVFVDSRAARAGETPIYDFFHLKYPRFEKTENALLMHHNTLVEENTVKEAERLGRDLTLEEAQAVPGIRDARDVWDFYRSEDGLKNFAGADWQPGAIGNFYLPSISRTQRALGESRAVMTTLISDLAARGTGAAVGLEEVIPGGIEGMRAAAAALPDAAEDTTRLYRVQVGSQLFGESKGGRDAEKLIWHDSIERARMTGLGLGSFGQFTYVDVPQSVLARAKEVTEEGLAKVNVTDWELPLEHGLTPTHIGPVGEWAEIGGRVHPVAGRLLAAPARFLEMLMARVPEGGTIRLWGNDTPTQLSRMLDMEYGGAGKGQMYEAIMTADSPIIRREMMRSALDRMFYNNGMYVDDTAREVAAQYIEGTKQRYALDDLDMISMGSSRNPAGIGPWSDHGDEIALPNFKEMGKQAQSMGVLHKVLGPSQAELWDSFMGKFWKPAMLFRLGFAPRAAAEEAIVTLLRAPHVYTEGALLRMAKAAGEPVVTYRDMSRLAKGMEIYMPAEIANDALMHPLDKFAHYLGNYGRQWVRGMATSRLDPQTLKGAQILAENPSIQHAVVDMMARVGSTRSNWDLPNQILLQTAKREPMYYIATSEKGLAAIEEAKLTGAPLSHPDVQAAKALSSAPIVYGPEAPVMRGMVHQQTDRVMRDHVQRPVAQARQLFVHESQAEAAFGPLTLRGLEATNGHEALRTAREAMAENTPFRNTYREYIHVLQRGDADDLTQTLYEDLNRIALESGDHRLVAVADAARTLPPDVAQTLLLDKAAVLRQLHRPDVPLDDLEHQLNGAALAIDPKRYTDELFASLPPVEEGKMRVYGRAGTATDETLRRQKVRAAWADTDTIDTPWKYVSSDPREILDEVMTETKIAQRGGATHTDHLIFADVDPKDLIEEDGRLLLTGKHQSAAMPWGTDIGTQLTDIRNWTQGVDGARARRWSDLADQALMGDATAARELGVETAKRQLQHPVNLRRVREMDRGIMDAEGNLVASPLKEGMVRVYFPTFKPSEADAAFLATDTSGSTGRRFVAGREDLSPTNVEAYESVGDGPLYAHSKFASTDSEEVRGLVEQIERDSAKVGQQLTVGMSYKDVPEESIFDFYKTNAEARGAGKFDYEIRFGDSLTATPVDLDRRTLVMEGHPDQPAILANGITFDQAMDSYAQVLNNRFDQLFEHEGRVIHELTVPGTEAGKMDPMWVFRRDTPMPARVLGPQYYTPEAPSIVDRIMRKGFDAAITPLTNAVSRNPLFINNAMRRVGFSDNLLRPILSDQRLVTQALQIGSDTLNVHGVDALYSQMRDMPTRLKDVQGLVDSGTVSAGWLNLTNKEFDTMHDFYKNEKIVRETIGERAAHGALVDTIPYIDDHHVRSQFADEVRNLIPFWWAQEAFFRRWGKTLAETPEAVRKAQLIMQGARHAGLVHKDAEGHDIFMIPGSNWLMTQANKPISMFFGGPAQLPIPVGISGDVRMATPGFDAVGVPGFGPLVGIPLAIGRRLFPEVGAIEKGLLGERGAGRNEFEHIFPAWATSAYKALTADGSRDTSDPQVASAAIMAMQYLEANGHGLAEDATPRQQQDWIDRVTNWSRSMLVTRALFSYADPAPAQLQIGTPEISEEFVGLMKNLGIHDALSEMVKRHPDATAYTIFSTKSKSGNLLPATEAAGKFMEKNRDFIDKYRYWSGWMLPQTKDLDENVRSVRALQRELGLRDMKTPEEWYTDFKFGAAADVYFNSKSRYEIAKEKTRDSKDRADLDQQWSDWKQKYFDQHPVFAEQLQTRGGQDRRATVLEEMHRAYADPNMPDFEHKAQFKVMMDSYDRYTDAMDKLHGQRGTRVSAQRKSLNLQFASWAMEYTNAHPETKLFYQRIIFPDVDLSGSARVKFDTNATPAKSNTTATNAPKTIEVPQITAPGTATRTAAPEAKAVPNLTGKEKEKVFKGAKSGPGLWASQRAQHEALAAEYPGADITMIKDHDGHQWWVTPDPDPNKKYVLFTQPTGRVV